MKKRGRELKVLTAAEIERVKAIYATGKCMKRTAKEAGVSQRAVERTIRNLGLSKNPGYNSGRKQYPAVMERTPVIIMMRLERRTLNDIQKATGLSKPTIAKILAANGIFKPAKIQMPRVRKPKEAQETKKARAPKVQKQYVETAELPQHWFNGKTAQLTTARVLPTDKIIPSLHDQHRQRWSNY